MIAMEALLSYTQRQGKEPLWASPTTPAGIVPWSARLVGRSVDLLGGFVMGRIGLA